MANGRPPGAGFAALICILLLLACTPIQRNHGEIPYKTLSRASFLPIGRIRNGLAPFRSKLRTWRPARAEEPMGPFTPPEGEGAAADPFDLSEFVKLQEIQSVAAIAAAWKSHM
eukprot:771039-Amorphochlora_amoeboformis.AAC.1